MTKRTHFAFHLGRPPLAVGSKHTKSACNIKDGFPTTAFGNDKALLGGEFAGGIGCRYDSKTVVN